MSVFVEVLGNGEFIYFHFPFFSIIGTNICCNKKLGFFWITRCDAFFLAPVILRIDPDPDQKIALARLTVSSNTTFYQWRKKQKSWKYYGWLIAHSYPNFVCCNAPRSKCARMHVARKWQLVIAQIGTKWPLHFGRSVRTKSCSSISFDDWFLIWR